MGNYMAISLVLVNDNTKKKNVEKEKCNSFKLRLTRIPKNAKGHATIKDCGIYMEF